MPPPDETHAWIAYDDQAIYVAFYCYDSRPSEIVAREIRPNSRFDGEDYVTFAIDAYNIRRDDTMSLFMVNALGTQSEQIAGGRANEREWRGDAHPVVGSTLMMRLSETVFRGTICHYGA